ncbi:glycosyltransferase family protein [Allonocardiopsis opalescens]|uniref:Putative glycosyltransferase n=1 Tax=Allonocardiopsis opalescens TaxID=1144618 RepID=A0A2T0Q012_9ACTN|nr:glycosyltransferase [Allonocardiopsis opalescens]PRX97127.1 putative glycosyltransferase [Allonocardiopsis opalescens]
MPDTTDRARPHRPRVALYSHDAQGLGHTRRNLALAGALSRLSPRPDTLLLSGAPEAAAFRRPPGCDLVSLPGLLKDVRGGYQARALSASLVELVGLRAAILCSTLRAFAPDLLVVDKHPRGVFGELEPALRELAAQGRTRVVLGLRDVLDDPSVAAAEWAGERGSQALRCYYDEVWAYGDPEVSDPVADLGLPADLAAISRHTGYLSHGRFDGGAAQGAPHPAPYVLGLAGGGGDGVRLAESFVRAPLPEGMRAVFVTGPQMPAADRARLAAHAAERPGVTVRGFVDDPGRWLSHASAVVAMGGYNTVCEALATAAPLLVVPRVRPRGEQLLRARRMAAAGLLDLLHPDRLSPARIGRWLAGAAVREPAPRTGVDLDGLHRIPGLATDLITAPRRRTAPESHHVAV